MKKLNRLIFPPQEGGDHNRVDFWRERVLHYMLLTALVLGLFALVPSVWLSLREGLFTLAIFDLLAYAYVLVIFIWRGLGYRTRAIMFAAIGYFIGIFVTLQLGAAGAGLYWIFVAPPMASLLLGLRSGILGIGLNALILVWLGYLITFQPQSFPQLASFSLPAWIVDGLNYLTANALVTLPLGALLDGMRFSFEREAQANVALSSAQQESKQKDVAFRESEERFNKSFHLNPVGMVLARLQDGRIIDVNQAWSDVYGYSQEEVRGKTMEELGTVTPEVRQSIRQELKNKGFLRNFEASAHTRDGNVRHVLISVENFPIGDDLFSLATTMDITERKQAEEKIQMQLEHLKALSEIDRAILSSFDLQFSLKIFLNQVVSRLGVDAANIMLFSSIPQNLESVAGTGFRTSAFEHRQLRLGEGNAGLAALERRIVHISHLEGQSGNPRLAKALVGESFTSYYGVPLIAKGQVMGVLEIFHRSQLEPDEEWLNFLNILAGQAAIAIDSAKLFESLQSSNTELALAYDATIEGWSRALDLRDKETEGHSRRVTQLTVQLAKAMGIKNSELVQIRRGALLHDIGKMGIPDSILLKPDELTEKEWEIMKQHPVHAVNMLGSLMYLKDALDIPYSHHEKWDGTGYPRGLKGEEIPLAARIFAVADVYDALTSNRPYRKAWTKAEALQYIREQSGKHFDPTIVDAFFNLDLPQEARTNLSQ
ncbi:MAG TPA: HD domain-containing phosphohydrolase [Dehalococcoidia bacterium]